MDLNKLFTTHHFPPAARETFLRSGIRTLFPPQAEAVKRGALEGKNMLLSVPTAAGKTFIAELCMVRRILVDGGRCLYIVPLKALAGEKYDDFRSKYGPLGINVGLATGDSDKSGRGLAGDHIVIATAEKVDALLRARTEWLINGLNVVVLDEIHFLNDDARGPTLEVLTARIRQLNPNAQILALSATVPNAEEMADWLDAGLVHSDWRPIPLKEGVYFNERIKFLTGPVRAIKEPPADDLSKLVLDTVRGKGQVLIFVNSRRSAQAASRQIAASTAALLTKEEKAQLAALSKDILGSPSSATKICRKLAEAVRHGVAFHHAGLKPKQRKLIEDNFRGTLIKAVCSTPTLAAGVNLPARRAVLRDVKRFENGLGSAYIPVSEYKQCAGRAGRPQYDPYGEAVIIAKSSSQSRVLMDRYIKASPEPVLSRLGNERALRLHILASIAGGYVHDVGETLEFLSLTFLAQQRRAGNLLDMIGTSFEFLEEEEFIEKSGFRFFATPFGRCTSRLYIDPVSALVLRAGLKKASDGKTFSSVGLLHVVSCCPDSPLLRFSHSETGDIDEFMSCYEDELIFSTEDVPILEDFPMALSVAKTTMLLTHWIEEEREEALCDRFGIGPGDIYRHIESGGWLLHAASEFAQLLGMKKFTRVLENLRIRVKYGVREELLSLTRLKGVGRVRARQLFAAGIKKPADLKRSSLEKLAAIPQIGRSLAGDLLRQVTETSYAERLRQEAKDNLQEWK